MSGLLAIAVADGAGLEAPVHEQFGRAPAFLLVDPGAQDRAVRLANDGAAAEHGAGIGAAAQLLRQRVVAVVAARFGPKAEEALRRGGVALYIAPPGTPATEVLVRFRAGALVRHELKVY